MRLLQPLSEPPVLGLQFRNQLDQCFVLIAQVEDFLNLFGAEEGFDLVDEIARSIWGAC